MEKLIYYLTENPFKEGKIVVVNKDELEKALNSSQNFEKILHVSGKEYMYNLKIYENVKRFEEKLKKEYNNEAGKFKGRCIIYLGAGIALSYLFFKPFFNLGYSPIRYLFESRYRNSIEMVPPEVVNEYIDIGAQWFARIVGAVLGSLPFIGSIFYGVKNLKKSRKLSRLAKKIEKIGFYEPKIVVNERLNEFEKESEGIITNVRKNIPILKAGTRKEKFIASKKINGEIQKLYNLSKSYELDGISKYYEELSEKFLVLQERLRKPRFWRNEDKFIKEILGEE